MRRPTAPDLHSPLTPVSSSHTFPVRRDCGDRSPRQRHRDWRMRWASDCGSPHTIGYNGGADDNYAGDNGADVSGDRAAGIACGTCVGGTGAIRRGAWPAGVRHGDMTANPGPPLPRNPVAVHSWTASQDRPCEGGGASGWLARRRSHPSPSPSPSPASGALGARPI